MIMIAPQNGRKIVFYGPDWEALRRACDAAGWFLLGVACGILAVLAWAARTVAS